MAAEKGSGAAGAASAEIGKYLEILAKDPNSRVFAPLAEAYRKAGLLDDAIETALEGLSVHPNYLGGRVALGRALFEKKRYAEAADEMRKVARAAPDNIIAHKVLGQIALAQGALPDAEKAFRMVVLLDPHDQEAKRALADIGSGAPPPAAAPAPQPTAATAVPAAPQSGQVGPRPPPPAEESPWGELSLELPPAAPGSTESPGAAGEESRSPAAPAAASGPLDLGDLEVGPPTIELEEPWKGPAPPVPQVISLEPEPEKGPLPAVEGPATEVPSVLPEIELPGRAGPESPAEIEIFVREPGAVAMPAAPAEEAAAVAGAGAAAEVAPEAGAESPFEVFGRQRAVPLSAEKGEREAYADIELEPTTHATAAPAPEARSEEEAVFEVFTRDPRGSDIGTRATGHGERPMPEQFELEPTAHLPEEPEEGEPPVIELQEEIPRIDMQRELELALAMERSPAGEPLADAEPAEAGFPALDRAAAEPVAAGEEIGWEEEATWQPPGEAEEAEEAATPVLLSPEEAATEELVWEAPETGDMLSGDEAPGEPELPLEPPLPVAPAPAEPPFDLAGPWEEGSPEAVPAGEPPAAASGEHPDEPALALPAVEAEAHPREEIVNLEEEIPSVDIAGEIAPETAVEPGPDVEPAVPPAGAGEAEPRRAEAAAAGPAPAAEQPSSGRGIFDTETLASIYINQGFYGRAAAIYERLAAGSPEDAALRRKLDEVRSLEHAQGGTPAAAGEEGAATPAGRADRAETIRRLEALLAAFRGGRPR